VGLGFFSFFSLVFWFLDRCCGGDLATTSTANSKRDHKSEPISEVDVSPLESLAMKRPDCFESPKRRLARAKQHIRRLKKCIQTFIKKIPPSRGEELDAEGWTVHSLRFCHPIPQSWADSAGDAIKHLGSALDQCGYTLLHIAACMVPIRTVQVVINIEIGN
jgi:hypothetical protein